MSTSESNTIIPDAELQAALAEIAKMSREEVEAIPSLDDGRDTTAAQTENLPVPESQPPRPENQNAPPHRTQSVSEDETQVSAALAQLEAAVQGQSAATDQSLPTPAAATAPATDAEQRLASAQERLGELPPEPAPADAARTDAGAPHPTTDAAEWGAGGPPDLPATAPAADASQADSRQSDETAPAASAPLRDVVGVAVAEVESLAAEPKEPTTSPPTARRGAVEDSATKEPARHLAQQPIAEEAPHQQASGGPAAARKLRFKVGQHPDQQGAPVDAAPEESAGTEAPAPTARPLTSLIRQVYRAADTALEALNKPFAFLGDGQRALVGWAALTTLVVSILAMLVMPVLMPHRDAVAFLLEKRAALDAPPPAQPDAKADSHEERETHGSPAPAGGHTATTDKKAAGHPGSHR